MRGVRRFGLGVTGLVIAVLVVACLSSPAAALAVTRPVVTAVSPANGSTVGGTTVTIRGKHFTVGGKSVVKKVLFGATAATSIKVKSAVLLTARAPRGTGTVNVRVVAKGGTSAVVKADRFVFKGAMPVVAAVSPAYGPTTGGTTVTVTGAGFTGATAVTFGSVAATIVKVTATTITAITPKHQGLAWDVRVTTPGGTSAVAKPGDQFTFYAVATVTGVSPGSGPQTRGTVVKITGTNLYTAKNISQAVKFGGVLATGVVVTSSLTITATAPAGTGTVDVTVTTLAGTTATSAADRFSYAPPFVTLADAISDVLVANGTSLGDAEAALPTTVTVSLSYGGPAIADVTWSEGSPAYDGGTAGSYPFVGTLSGLPGVTNPNNVTAAVNVNVGS